MTRLAHSLGSADTSPMLPADRAHLMTSAAALLLLAAPGCDVKTSDSDLRNAFLDPPAANEKIHSKGGMFEAKLVPCWVDPRGKADYAKGHIAGAINVPLAEMQEAAAARLAGHNLLIVYGDSFQDPMAKAGAKRLIELGFKKDQVFILEGGTRAWQKEGYSLVTGAMPNGGDEPAKEKVTPTKDSGVEVPEKGVR